MATILNKGKLHQAILYISKRCEGDPSFGKTKLYKTLFAADFHHYGVHGTPITGARYSHFPKGPVPEEAREALREMRSSGRIAIRTDSHHGAPLKKPVVLVDGDDSILSDTEKESINCFVKEFKDKNATELSKWTHKLLPWLATYPNEVIPYHAIFVLEHIPVEVEAMRWARTEIERLRKEAA